MATWSKVRQQLESFLAPSLQEIVKYTTTSYKFKPDKTGKACILVEQKEVFRMNNSETGIRWYQTEQDILKDDTFRVFVTEEEKNEVRNANSNNIPEERIGVIAEKKKRSECAKKIISAQNNLVKANFHDTANQFLTTSIDKCMDSDDILLNILAILDRRTGKNRLRKIENQISEKHPVVQYFYGLRCCAEKIK